MAITVETVGGSWNDFLFYKWNGTRERWATRKGWFGLAELHVYFLLYLVYYQSFRDHFYLALQTRGHHRGERAKTTLTWTTDPKRKYSFKTIHSFRIHSIFLFISWIMLYYFFSRISNTILVRKCMIISSKNDMKRKIMDNDEWEKNNGPLCSMLKYFFRNESGYKNFFFFCFYKKIVISMW